MLYIQKKTPPGAMLRKVSSIKSSNAWKSINIGNTDAIRDAFNELPKEEIRRRYLNEEGNEENRFSRDAVILLNEYVKADIRITEEGEDKDMCKGIKDLMDEARGEGREEGEDRLATLIIRVKESGRDIELMDILKDNVLRAQLYLEYNIK